MRAHCNNKLGSLVWFRDILDSQVTKYWNQKVADARKPSNIVKKAEKEQRKREREEKRLQKKQQQKK